MRATEGTPESRRPWLSALVGSDGTQPRSSFLHLKWRGSYAAASLPPGRFSVDCVPILLASSDCLSLAGPGGRVLAV